MALTPRVFGSERADKTQMSEKGWTSQQAVHIMAFSATTDKLLSILVHKRFDSQMTGSRINTQFGLSGGHGVLLVRVNSCGRGRCVVTL